MTKFFLMPLCLLLAGSGVAAAQQPPAQQGDATNGHRLWMADGCYQCHGTVAQGGVGPRLAPDPLPAEAIAAYIRAPVNVMPPYTDTVLNDAGVADIQAYLATIPPPPKLQDIPLLAR